MLLQRENILKNIDKIKKEIYEYSPYPEKVKILAVTKYFTIEEHKLLNDFNILNYYGENRAQLFRDKINEINSVNIKWDFIGRLQKNKIKYIIENINLIHSIDSEDLLLEINKKAKEMNIIVNGLLQINISNEVSKTGFNENEILLIHKNLFSQSNVKIVGLMTMMPFEANIDELKLGFNRLLQLKEKFKKEYPYCEELSMGMSGDYIEALKQGATIIRIGTKLFE